MNHTNTVNGTAPAIKPLALLQHLMMAMVMTALMTMAATATAQTAKVNTTETESVEPTKVDINQADTVALETIPGIGPSKAAKIIELREQLDGFESFEMLLEVSGIGEHLLEMIKEHSVLDGVEASDAEDEDASKDLPKKTKHGG